MQLTLVYAEFDIFCLVIMLMITLATLLLYKKLINRSLYLVLMGVALSLVTSDLIYELSLAGIIHAQINVLYFVNAVYFSASTLIAMLWMVYSIRLTGVMFIKSSFIRALFAIPAIFVIFIICTSFSTHWIFYIDEQGIYYRGSMNWISYIIPILYFICAVVWAVVAHIREASPRTRKNLQSIFIFIFFPTGAVTTQLLFQGAPMVCIGAVLGMLWVFISNVSQEREQMAAGQLIAETKSQFFASMSHELRTPINAVLGMNTMILRESREEAITGYARVIENSGKMLLSTINDILDFSKAESGNLSLVRSEYETAELIRDVVLMTKSKAEDKGLEFNIDIDKNIPSILIGDDVRIRQVIINLLTNAVKYTDRGSVTFRMTFRNCEENTIRLDIAVTDTGRGIRKESIPKLFTPYMRNDEKKEHKIEGTGLGLAIVKKLLDLMESELIVDSVFGVGSTFSFSLVQPVGNRKPIGCAEDIIKKADKTNIEYKTFRAPSARILTVDDTVVNNVVFKELLKQTGIQIDVATSGSEALNKVVDNEYDVIFLDHMMPGMDGVETLSRMRSEENTVTDATPVIALTANVVAGYREMFMEAGFDEFLAKPIDVKELERMLLRYIPKEKIESDTPVEKAGPSTAGDTVKNDTTGETKAGAFSPERTVRKDRSPREILDYLRSVQMINLDEGLRLATSESIYLTALEAFLSIAQEQHDTIERLSKEANLRDYTVEVHSLKSNSKLLGVNRLSALALELEMAGKEENSKLVQEKTPELLTMYEELIDALMPLVAEQES